MNWSNLSSANAAQTKAIETTEGRLLVLAGAGSGKTKVIVHRIAHLIEYKQVPSSAILGLTFTNKAAKEMKERLEGLIDAQRAKGVTLCTFHSFCMQVLRKEIEKLGYTKEFSLYDDRDMDRVIHQLTQEMMQQEKLPSLGPTKVALQQMFNCEEPSHQNSWHDQFTKELYERLQSTLRAYNALNFDHLINLTITLFERYPEVLDRYQERARYLMIDEYQDTNPSQFRLAELLSEKYQNLCVVGDDDQSIYGWRGAKVDHILHFKKDFLVTLEQNFRSTQLILDAANHVIQHNQERHSKHLWSDKKNGDSIEVFNAPTETEEANGVVQRLLAYKQEKGLLFSDFAILYRSNALSRSLEMALLNASWQKDGKWVRGIPYEIFGGLEFSERSEIKDLFAYLRVIANPLDEEALLRIINVPRRGISDTSLDLITQQNRKEKIPLWQKLQEVAQEKKLLSKCPRALQGISSFVLLILEAQSRFAKESLVENVKWLIERINYKQAIIEEVKSEKMRQFKWENIEECLNAVAEYEMQEKEEACLQDFIGQSSLNKSLFPAHKKQKEDKVQLMTLHSAKGLEFVHCFIIGLEDHILPHEKSVQETGIEEERRLFYVGLTRAKKWLTLSMARARMRMGKTHPTQPSRFLFEIPKHLMKIT